MRLLLPVTPGNTAFASPGLAPTPLPPQRPVRAGRFLHPLPEMPMKKPMKRPLVLAMLIALSACGGGGGGGGGGSGAVIAPSASAQSIAVEVMQLDSTQVQHVFQASGTSLTYSISRQPRHGSATINPSTGAISYTVTGTPTETTDSLEVTVSNSAGTVSAELQIALKTDPLVTHQWHLKNTGESAFASNLPVAGIDLKVVDAWRLGYSGKGVKVNVVDSGLELAHEDLAANILAGASKNLITGSNDPSPDAAVTDGDHGTSVAGLIAAVAFNNKGVRGVAHGAGLMGYNFIESTQRYLDLAESFGLNPALGSTQADIFNASFGGNSCQWRSPDATEDDIMSSVKNLRGSKGALVIKSAGNRFSDCVHPTVDPTREDLCRSAGVSCKNAAGDPANTLDHMVVVGAANAAGVKSSYSSTGANLWITGLGGEYGYDAALFPGHGLPADHAAFQPAMITVDQSGCDRGYHTASPINTFEAPGPTRTTLNPQCNYTSVFNGTSSAAPTVSGVVALMLEARPELTDRDVKHILADTATRIDANRGTLTNTSIFGAPFTLERGWVTNAAGRSFSNWYGFGLVNAGAAVQKAKTHALLPAQRTASTRATAGATLITKSSTTPLARSFTMGSSLAVETVEVQLPVNTAAFNVSCNQVELVSPSGTKSILLNMATDHVYPPLGGNMRFLSNAFYGETSSGTWTLQLFNRCNAAQQLASGTEPLLTIKGH